LKFVYLCLLGSVLLYAFSFFNEYDHKDVDDIRLSPAPIGVKASSNIGARSAPRSLSVAVGDGSKGFVGRDKLAMRDILTNFNTGNYESALSHAEKQLRDRGLSSNYLRWLRLQMPTLLSTLGWNFLQLDRCPEAISFFSRSIDYKSTQPALKGLGICSYKEKDWHSAIDNLKAYIEKEPADHQIKLLLVEGYESLGSFSDAVALLEDVVSAPELAGDDKLRIRLKAMKAKEAEGERQSVIGSPHFSITSRIGEHESLAEKSLSILEAALSELEDLGISAPEAPLEVFLYPDETYDSAISYGPRWSTGLFDGKLRIRVPGNIENIDLRSHKKILRHEMFHGLMGRKKLPYWLSEGLAQYFECEGGCSQVSVPSGGTGKFLSDKIFNKAFTQLSKPDADRVYRQSLFLVQVMKEMAEDDYDRPLVIIARKMQKDSSPTVKSLVSSIGLSFVGIYKESSGRWNSLLGH